MKRILFISQYLDRNGTEAFMMSVFRGIDHTRFAVDFLLYTQRETDYTHEVEAAGFHVYRVTPRRESVVRWHRELNAFFASHARDYHAVHFCGNSLTSIAPVYYAWKYKIPVRIIHAHNSSCRGLHNKLLHLVKRWAASCMATHRFACSTYAARWFFGSKPAKIVTNGIDVNKFAFDPAKREAVRRSLEIATTTKVIGHVGRFVPEKNHEMLVEIFTEFTKHCPDSVLLLVGKGALEERISKQCKTLGINGKVKMLGERSDVNQLMQAMDLFLMPSLFEGQPYVLIEAQAAGLPCVVSDVVNSDIAITLGVQFLPLADSAEAWAKCIEKIIEGKFASESRTAAAEMIRKAGYSIEDTIGELEEIYNQNN